MEYNEQNLPVNDTALLKMLIDSMIERQNEQSQTIADLRRQVEAVVARQDEVQHFTTEEFGQQVVEQVMLAMPAIQAAAMKKAKARPVIGGSRQ